MEAAVVNLLSPGDKAICVEAGKFGERWTELCKAYGINAVVIAVEWGKGLDPKVLEKTLNEHKDTKVVFTTHCETSTGALTNVEAAAKITRGREAVLVVDAISSLGGVDLKTDEWGIDVVVTGSQKGLMIPPGLAFCSVNEKAWKLVEKAKCPRYYFDFTAAKKALKDNDTAYTPAVTLCIGVNEAIKMIKKETLEKTFARHSQLARAVREAMKALGLKLFAQDAADVVTSVCVPEGIDGGKIVKKMRDEFGVSIAGGQGHLQGKIFRFAQLGYMNEFDIIIGISCLEIVLAQLGYKFTLGSGVGAAEKELLKK